MPPALRRLALLLLAPLAACAAPPRPAAPSAGPPPAPVEARTPVTILVSIDGFRPDYLHRGDTPALDRLADEGVAGTMRPSFPALTFSNHETLATGLRPDRSGIVAGVMFDPRRPDVRFANNEPAQATDPFWWDGAEPIWISAERAGIHAGVMFWPGLEVAHGGVRPGDWARFDSNYLGPQRVRTLLDWMRRPAAIRPALAMLYLDAVDRAGHRFGPAAPETIAAVREVDAGIAEIVAELARLGQPANLLIVSDHGMAAVRPERALVLDDLLPKDSYRWAQWGPFAGIDPRPGQEARVAAVLLAPHPHATCWRKADLPARFRYGTHPRVPAILCVARDGGEVVPVPPTNRGDHGYDPADPDMAALFLAHGPAFRAGVRLPPGFDNVEVYPLLRRLIGLPPAADVDGTGAIAGQLLRR
jgi:predicted AlkP superfamily pyrophosphatase or phosphodiesterase